MADPQQIDQFQLARDRAKQQAAQGTSERLEAIKRRFAAMGGGPGSGEQLKIEQQAQQAGDEQVQAANESIGAAETQEKMRKDEIQQARQFQTSEREAQQNFASAEGAKQREFATSERTAQNLFSTGERESSQKFAVEQAGLQRDWTSKQSEIDKAWQAGQTEKAQGLQKELFNSQMDFETKKFNAAKEQFQQTFEEEQRINNKNIEFADKVLNEKGFADKIMGGFGQIGSAWGKFTQGIVNLGGGSPQQGGGGGGMPTRGGALPEGTGQVFPRMPTFGRKIGKWRY